MYLRDALNVDIFFQTMPPKVRFKVTRTLRITLTTKTVEPLSSASLACHELILSPRRCDHRRS